MHEIVPPDEERAREELERLARFLGDFRPTTAEMEEALRLAAEYYALRVLAPEERARFLADALGFDMARQTLEEVRKARQQRPGFRPR